MLVLQETTKSFPETQRHTYLVTSDKFKTLGYIKHGETRAHTFKTPLQFDTRGRTFKTLKV